MKAYQTVKHIVEQFLRRDKEQQERKKNRDRLL